MLTLKLNRNSWHYKWAQFLGWEEVNTRYWPHTPNDFCSYLRRIFFGSILCLGAGALAIFAGISIVIGFFSFWWMVFHGFDKTRTGLEGIGGIASVIGAVLSVVHGFRSGRLHFRWLKLPNLPSCEDIPLCEDTKRFFVAAYEVVRNNMCFKLEFHDGETNGTTSQNEGSSS